jgi:GNAT superfamily N-acetyltransferase
LGDISAPALCAPTRLTHKHEASDFACGEEALDSWLRQHALRGEGRLSRTYVVCAADRIAGFYCLLNGAVRRTTAVSKLRRNASDPAPVMVIGRLAVDRGWQGRGVARGLLRDAVLRTLQASEVAGIAALLVHAISADARRLYESSGFTDSELEPTTLMITLKEAVAALG